MKKRLFSLMLVTAIIMSSAGCGNKAEKVEGDYNTYSKDELIEEVNFYKDNYSALEEQNAEMRELIKAVDGEAEKSTAISKVGDGSDRLSFNSINNEIVLTDAFKYPGSTQVNPDGFLAITSNVICKPTSNWVCKLDSTKLEVEHKSSGISGVISVGTITEMYTIEELRDYVMKDWLSKIPIDNIKNSTMYINTLSCGVMARGTTLINEEDAVIKCGMVSDGSMTVALMFTYKGSIDANKEEIVDSLISTLELNGGQLTIE